MSGHPSIPARRLVLASASPARREVLRRAGLAPEVVVSGVDEAAIAARADHAGAAELTEVLARAKAEAVAGRAEVAGSLVVGCDSMLEVDGVGYGKPHRREVALERWRTMSGRAGVLHTGHRVIDTVTGRAAGGVESTVVRFGRPTEAELEAYVASGEPLEVAGAFTIDGLGGSFLAGIDGNPSNVIGLSVPYLRTLLAEVGVAVTDLWTLP